MFALSKGLMRITASMTLYIIVALFCLVTGNDPGKQQKCKYISHFCVLFLCRGADSQAMDRDGRTALQYAIDGGTSDEDILILLEDHSR